MTRPRAWVVGIPHMVNGGRVGWTWHYGSAHGFGTTSGALQHAEHYASRRDAEDAAARFQRITGKRSARVFTILEAERLVVVRADT